MTVLLKQKRIMIIEDDKGISSLLEELFLEEKYEVMTAGNGLEAVELLRSSPALPDVIFLDLMMPIMDGIQFKRVQENDPSLKSIPVVLMSANHKVDPKKLPVKIDHHLKKPMNLDDIFSILRNLGIHSA